jgi:hypothetical protein
LKCRTWVDALAGAAVASKMDAMAASPSSTRFM